MIFDGTISCKAILEEKKRKVICLFVDRKKRSKDLGYILAIAKKQNIQVNFVDREELNEICGHHKHGGVAIEALEKQQEQLHEATGFLCYIDGLEDPYNLGSVCRTLYAAGCNALFLPKRDWRNAEPVILKASAGAYEKMEILFKENDDDLLAYLKEKNIPLICAARKDAVSLYEFCYPETFCLAVGGALRGISSKVQAQSAQNVFIPYAREARNALDTASAVAVFAFEYVRQIQ
jgi:23S rRNA (guanosine2251-2'-O)-methyltransferase